MFRNLHKSSIHVAGIFCLLLLAYHLIFRDYFPLANGRMGHDYVLTLGGFLDGFLWYKNNGFLTPPWFTPSFCGGQALFADPQSAFYSLPQFLTFMVDPLQAVYSAFLIFAGLGFWGMYLFSRRCLHMGRPSALVAATVFMFNGFYAHRIIIGHYGYQSFMLVPLIAYLLLKVPDSPLHSARSIRQSLIAGLAIAYWFHSGLTTLMIPATLAVIGLACVMRISTKEYIAKTFLVRGLVAGAVAIALSASKLDANLALMGNFSRDYYPLPGVSDIGGLLTFVFQSLFYSSEHTYQTVTPLWESMQWAAMPHELAYGLTPLPLLIMVVGAGAFALSSQSHEPLPSRNTPSVLFPSILLAAILLAPLALLYYSPEWNAILKNLPLIGSTTSPYRWLIIYIPLIAALTGITLKASGKYQTGLAVITVLGIPLLNALESREYYQQQDFDPTPIVSYYNAVTRGEITQKITQVGDPKTENGHPVIDNSLFIKGISPMRCYNPLYGYRQEKLKTAPLTAGPIETPTGVNSLNLHNPACFVFPAENNCHPWDAFSSSQMEELQNFANYRPYSFEKSARQHVADFLTLLALCILSLALLWGAIKSLKTGGLATCAGLRNSVVAAMENSPATQVVAVIIMTWLSVFLITLGVSPNGLTAEALAMVKQTFLPGPEYFQPEPRERIAYLLTITLFPAFSMLLTILLQRTRRRQDSPLNLAQTNWPTLAGTWLLFILICTVMFAAKEAPFGNAFGFFTYIPVLALLGTPYPLILAILFIIAYVLYTRESSNLSRLSFSPKTWINGAIDLAAIALITFLAAHMTFIPEDTGALAWAPDLVHMAPVFETAATAYLTNATAGADMISQYGGLVEFARPLLWLLDGDPLALMWFSFLALAIACLAQWLALRKVTGNALISLLAIAAMFYLTGIKFIPFACFQCVHLRWFWPSIFLCLAAFYSPRTKLPYLPYLLFPIATYWNPETGLASTAAWIGWRFIVNVLPVAIAQEWKLGITSLLRSTFRPVVGVSSGFLLIVFYVASKSGQLLDFGLMSRFAKDFYLYGFYMLPMPALHLWNVYAVIAGTLLVIGIRYYADRQEANPDDTKYGFIVYACLLFSLLFAYYQGRSFYGNLFAISYPLWLAIMVWLYSFRSEPLPPLRRLPTTQPLRVLGIFLVCLGFAASLTTSFQLRPISNPLSKQNTVEKAELRSWVERTANGRTPLFISLSAWRLMLITGTSYGSGTIPMAALLRQDQLDSYLAELGNPKYALYYDLTNDIYFAAEGTTWANKLKQRIREITANSEASVPTFENNQGRLILLNPARQSAALRLSDTHP